MHEQHEDSSAKGSRRRRTGADRLVSTSVHLQAAYLDRITALGDTPSEFCRQAVAERLEREEGYLAAIERTRSKKEHLISELELVEKMLIDFEDKHAKFNEEQETSKLRDIVLTEILTGSYQTEIDLFTAIKDQLKKNAKPGLKQMVHEVWIDIKGEAK